MRISIVALNASPAVFPDAGKAIGGTETFAWRLARGLARELDSGLARSDSLAPKEGECAERVSSQTDHPANQVQFVVRTPRPIDSRTIQQVRVDSFHEPWREVKHRVSQAMEIHSCRKLPRLKRWNIALAWQVPLLLGNKLLGRPYSEQAELQKTLSSFQPEVIVALGVNETSSQVTAIAEAIGCKVLLWLQSNADLDHRLYSDPNFVDAYGVRASQALQSLTKSDAILCQTRTQLDLLQRLVDSPDAISLANSMQARNRIALLENPIEIDPSARVVPYSDRKSVIWVGRADRFHKRPHLALEIANKCPNLLFKLVLNQGEPEVHRSIESQKPPNVTLLDYLPPSEMLNEMARSLAFLSTGSDRYEGFLNVLLEACRASTPIVSLHDFDSFLQRSRAGVVTGESTDLAAATLNRWAASPSDWQGYSDQGRLFVQSHHDLKNVLNKFKEILRQIT